MSPFFHPRKLHTLRKSPTHRFAALRSRRTWPQANASTESLKQRIVLRASPKTLRLLLPLLLIATVNHHLLGASPVTGQSLSYVGSFRVPRADGTGRWRNDSKISYFFGGDVSAVGEQGDELWISGHAQRRLVGKIAIPDHPVKPSSPEAFQELPIAHPTLPLFDITQGLKEESVQGSHWDLVLGDLVSEGKNVRWVLHAYYNVSQTPYRILGLYDTISGDAFGPYEFVHQNGSHLRGQLSGGYLMEVPEPWAGVVGGRYAAGGGGFPGQAHAGAGPSLYAFNPPPEGADPLETDVKVHTLLEYPWDNDLSTEERRRFDGWNRASKPHDAVWIGDSVVVVATVASGPVWYGMSDDGPGDLVDRYDPYKGYHAPHYEMRLFFYHASDLAAVSQGIQQPWEPRPYANVLMPHLMGSTLHSQFHKVSLSWDPGTSRLYVVQTRVDCSRSRYDHCPVVHVYDMNRPAAPYRWSQHLSGTDQRAAGASLEGKGRLRRRR